MRSRVPSMSSASAIARAIVVLSIAAVAASCTDRVGEPTSAGRAPAAPAPLEVPEQAYAPAARAALDGALASYDAITRELAADRFETVREPATRLADSIDAALAGPAAPTGAAAEVLGRASESARALGAAPSLEAAREAFAETSRLLIAVVGADPALAAGWQVWQCPMLAGDTFAKWLQADAEGRNPYMGPGMEQCRVATDYTVPATGAPATGAHDDPDGSAWYTCSMHPSVRAADPGNCPICNMQLVPVTHGEIASGVVRIDAERRQRIGVRLATVEAVPLTASVRAVGRVTYDESRLADVSVKFRGWIERLDVDRVGQAVERGEPLFTIYSPELLAAQEEYLLALASQRAAQGTPVPDRADYLVDAARRRLGLWDLSAGQLDRLAASGEPLEAVPILSPVAGHVIEKNVVAGASVEPGMRLYRIAALDRVWVEADVQAPELPLVRPGDRATVSFPNLPGRTVRGTVTFVYPFLDDLTRTGRVRVEVPNPDLELKPDLYANVALERDLGERLVVPEDAVLYAGERRFVFVDLGEGRLRPQQVVTGVGTDGLVEVLSGLAAGDRVVASGNFLVAAESRLRLAIEQWGGDSGGPAAPPPAHPPAAGPGDHAGHGGPGAAP